MQPAQGQRWVSADGSRLVVEVTNVENEWVFYKWTENGQPKYHKKLRFAFQCRYCLIGQNGVEE